MADTQTCEFEATSATQNGIPKMYANRSSKSKYLLSRYFFFVECKTKYSNIFSLWCDGDTEAMEVLLSVISYQH